MAFELKSPSLTVCHLKLCVEKKTGPEALEEGVEGTVLAELHDDILWLSESHSADELDKTEKGEMRKWTALHRNTKAEAKTSNQSSKQASERAKGIKPEEYAGYSAAP
jgi:hypothetical protein